MSNRWSEQLARHYSLRLTPDLIDWFDNDWWQHVGGGEFHRPLEPAMLLDPPPGLIWTGLLPPDMLPLVSNDYGDLLCMRVGRGSEIQEITLWRHGGGDWIPYGKTLAEAMLYDAVVGAPFSQQEQFHEREEVDPAERYTFAKWAMRHVPSGHEAWPDGWTDPRWPASLQAANIAVDCLSRDECLRHLHTPLREARCVQVARELEIVWSPDFVSWQHDGSKAPAEALSALAEQLDTSTDTMSEQDWNAAAVESLQLIERRTDLAWAWDIIGWREERNDDPRAAIDAYLKGLGASRFTDQSIDFRTHWFEEACGKFAAWRLRELREHLTLAELDDPYLQILIAADGEKLRQRVGSHWIELARRAVATNDHALAYDYFQKAGWDIGLETRAEYEEVLLGLIASATKAEDFARVQVAKAHLAAM